MSESRKLNSVDLFAGCGGLSLGLRQADFETLAFSEINKDAARTFETNLGGEGVQAFSDVADLTKPRLQELKRGWAADGKEIDLVCGGPPCQGYSGIGHRRSYKVEKDDIPSNHLFKHMVRVIRELQPKAFLFENVRGLLTGRWTASGANGEIWQDVRHEFERLGNYEIGWRLVQAKEFGVPQNRPRILLVGVSKDLGLQLEKGDRSNPTENPRGLIPSPSIRPPDLVEVLSDLDDPDFEQKDATTEYLNDPLTTFQRDLRRKPSGRGWARMGDPLMEQEYTRHSARIREKFTYMLQNGGEIPDALRTKKFAQRLLPPRWGKDGPTITATSLPDDFVHYARPRILTVREWARLQTFPDWFRFSGPRTTGGLRRAGKPTEGIWEREVPKYTQIGNAVPVRLAKVVGEHLAQLLRA